ncbi:hypothetical protein Ddye_019241 [Dipteronia dyeriana]|uniref:Uncharacterized protein n=1 Tax=Dipteronia dyeriana TaxID=168575 RepID=A0AAD9TXW1_9ROSI|nr:hypothetical protein Ddye_019241 [Dipteronia dyeriana]
MKVGLGSTHVKNISGWELTKQVHKTGRWKRVRREGCVASEVYENGSNLGKRISSDYDTIQQGSSKKTKETPQSVIGKLIEADETGNCDAYLQKATDSETVATVEISGDGGY